MAGMALGAQAQDANDSIIHMPAQLTFISPLGTNGMASGRTINNFSVNLILGYHYGLDGAEFSGFMSTLKGSMKGLQAAGFGNVVLGPAYGAQFSGFFNHVGKQMRGAQFAGFSNTILDSAVAAQFAGFGNLTKGSLQGGQAAGFGNVVTGSFQGFQLAGFGNVTNGDCLGLQAAGFGNVVKGDLKGAQIAGFSNVATGDVIGMQVAGFANTARKSITGMQISGFVNYASKVVGSQIGFINVADTIKDGAAIGFLSIVKDGYRRLEIGTNESFQGYASFKTGTEKFYNIFSAGLHVENRHYLMWGFGYGIGTLIPLQKHWAVNIDAVSYQINQNEWFTDKLNLLNRANINAVYRLGHLEIAAGPAFNILVTQLIDDEGQLRQPNISTGWSVYDYTNFRTNIRMYPGFNVAVRL